MSAEGDTEVGRRSSSPPGKESREDWKGGERTVTMTKTSPPSSPKPDKKSSRSRSPRSKSPVYRGRRDDRDTRYQREGTKTNSREPHLQRARLFVGNIELNTHRKDIIELFSRHGEVLGVSVHKGYAFVQMDRERSANRAINYEDNRNFMGSRIHVEFSQAALKAGAKFERINIKEPVSQDLLRSQPSSRSLHTSLSILEIEREREERLSRILTMERELALLRTREESASRRSLLPEAAYDRYETYRRDRSPLRRESEYPSQRDYPPKRDYPRSDRLGYDRGRGEDDRGRDIYNGRSDVTGYRGGSGIEGYRSAGVSDAYSGTVSYPVPGRGGYTESSQGLVGGALSHGSRGGVGYGQTSESVGYARKVGLGSGAPPPGWPSSDYDKSNTDRPPFVWN